MRSLLVVVVYAVFVTYEGYQSAHALRHHSVAKIVRPIEYPRTLVKLLHKAESRANASLRTVVLTPSVVTKIEVSVT